MHWIALPLFVGCIHSMGGRKTNDYIEEEVPQWPLLRLQRSYRRANLCFVLLFNVSLTDIRYTGWLKARQLKTGKEELTLSNFKWHLHSLDRAPHLMVIWYSEQIDCHLSVPNYSARYHVIIIIAPDQNRSPFFCFLATTTATWIERVSHSGVTTAAGWLHWRNR